MLYYTIADGYEINKIHSYLHIYGIMQFYEQQDIKQERHLEKNVFQVLGLLTSLIFGNIHKIAWLKPRLATHNNKNNKKYSVHQ